MEPLAALDLFFNVPASLPDPSPKPSCSVVAIASKAPIIAYPSDFDRGNVCIVRLNHFLDDETLGLASSSESKIPSPSSLSASSLSPPHVQSSTSSSLASSSPPDPAAQSHDLLEAHKHPITALALDKTGRLLATAALRGTIIRVWDTTTLKMVAELKRSSAGRTTTIHSITFSDDGSMLVVSSSSPTVHVFALSGPKKGEKSFAKIRLDDLGIADEQHTSSFSADGLSVILSLGSGMLYRFALPSTSSSSEKCTELSKNFMLPSPSSSPI